MHGREFTEKAQQRGTESPVRRQLNVELAGAMASAGAGASVPTAAPDQRPAHAARRAVATLRRQAIHRRSLALADMLAAALALLVCVGPLSADDSLHALTLLALPLVIVAGKLQRLADRDELVLNKSTIDEAPKLFQLATFYAALVYVFDDQLLSGTLDSARMLVLWVTLFVFTLAGRWLTRGIVRHAIGPERCLFVGSDESFQRLGEQLAGRDPRAELVGRMSLSPSADPQVVAAASAQLHQLITDLDVHRLVIEPSHEAPQHVLDFVREAKATGVPVSLLPRILDVVGSSIEIDDVDGMTLLGVRHFGLSRSSLLLKRGFDVVLATLALLVLAPLFALVALLIKLDSRGPVFFRQTRVGRDGERFEMWKFRSMVGDADAQKALLREYNEAGPGLFKIADDPRMTRVGRIIRRLSLDELPQLFNVLRGEMSLVGPRPLVCDEDEQIVGWDRRRLHLTPGMTGHWQILGSSRVPRSEMVKLDYLYVAGWSLWSDVKILLRTLPHMIARRGM
jgi:exopolysaccharide biosynthesis polyprenyl glycosylphosphotransferase